MKTIKTYLFPEGLRRGQPVQVFIAREESAVTGLDNYWLGVNHAITQVGNQYSGVSKRRISKRCYEALLAESRRNHRRYKARVL